MIVRERRELGSKKLNSRNQAGANRVSEGTERKQSKGGLLVIHFSRVKGRRKFREKQRVRNRKEPVKGRVGCSMMLRAAGVKHSSSNHERDSGKNEPKTGMRMKNPGHNLTSELVGFPGMFLVPVLCFPYASLCVCACYCCSGVVVVAALIVVFVAWYTQDRRMRITE